MALGPSILAVLVVVSAAGTPRPIGALEAPAQTHVSAVADRPVRLSAKLGIPSISPNEPSNKKTEASRRETKRSKEEDVPSVEPNEPKGMPSVAPKGPQK
jgi:hypothetical protein